MNSEFPLEFQKATRGNGHPQLPAPWSTGGANLGDLFPVNPDYDSEEDSDPGYAGRVEDDEDVHLDILEQALRAPPPPPDRRVTRSSGYNHLLDLGWPIPVPRRSEVTVLLSGRGRRTRTNGEHGQGALSIIDSETSESESESASEDEVKANTYDIEA